MTPSLLMTGCEFYPCRLTLTDLEITGRRNLVKSKTPEEVNEYNVWKNVLEMTLRNSFSCFADNFSLNISSSSASPHLFQSLLSDLSEFHPIEKTSRRFPQHPSDVTYRQPIGSLLAPPAPTSPGRLEVRMLRGRDTEKKKRGVPGYIKGTLYRSLETSVRFHVHAITLPPPLLFVATVTGTALFERGWLKKSTGIHPLLDLLKYWMEKFYLKRWTYV
ncbi:hypothetical protein TNCT_13321 [Trichonephila clavata]|uniref:Uncharacterized protein n=1 Tax=Trichonephila clavata TaxID=2740835 RepID=A0A8X6HLR5_TRICU|nr:hypothetical protein TNCT_13321 [Trichonephila clavata]